MSSEVELLQGASDLILLRALEGMGPQHADSLAARLEQVPQSRLTLKQGTRALAQETERWRRLAGFVDALLLNEP